MGNVSCSQCGQDFIIPGRTDGFSHCENHYKLESSVNHTPGPWFLDSEYPEFERADLEIHSSREATHVTTVCDWGKEFKEVQIANAHLIAAAPEMLEALEMCRELLQGQLDSDDGALNDGAISDALSNICKTVTKAKGGNDE